MEGAIEGAVENGRRGQLVAERLFVGEVGVRERGEALELAWFGKAASLRAPVGGTLDGRAIRIDAVQSEGIASTAQGERRGATRVNVATASWIDAL